MDAEQQAAGEKRVREHLIDPLLGLGLARPSKLRVAAFETMLKTLAQALAYMGEADLVVLRERAARSPGGKDRDQFPLALHILDWAKDVKAPDTGGDASPYVGRVMASRDGAMALEKGYAPEFLTHVKANRGVWPKAWTISKIRDAADDARRRYDDLQWKANRGDELSQEDRQFIAKRSAAIAECRRLAEVGAAREVSA
jgi:hypothetical protein